MNEIRHTPRILKEMLTQQERNQALILAAFAVTGAIVEALSIGAVFPFIALLSMPDAILSHPSAASIMVWLGHPSPDKIALIGACSLLLLYIAKNLYLAGLYAFQSHFVCNVESRIAVTLLSGYLHAPYTDRLSSNSAERIRIITSEVNRVAVGALLSFITLFSEIFVITAITILLLYAQPLVAAIAGLVVGLVALLMQTVFRKKIDIYKQSRITTASRMVRWVNEGLGALKEIRVLNREEFIIDGFLKNSRTYAHGTYWFMTLSLLPRIIFETAAICTILLAVIATVLAGNTLSSIVPALTIFGLAALRLLPSGSRIISCINTMSYYTPAVHTVAFNLKKTLHASIDQSSANPVSTRQAPFSSLKLSAISYCYPNTHKPSLNEVNLQIKRGDVIAIVGRSGSGKTTLTDLLLGLLEPTAGTIEVNGRPVHSLKAEWRGIAGLVPQEIYLIDDTVRRNVAFGVPDVAIDDARVWLALRLASLEGRVQIMPQGLDSPVGERGASLSGGERQRLGIARALYADPDILVLDEATSALDSATEAEFIDVLQSLRGNKTILIITHRISTMGWCDRMLLMNDGKIIADATPLEISSTHPDLAEAAGK
ncbi:MAG: ABC transporter ATP-binding protein [Betaproteobacteria bacterium]|jgi:ABC-type multidrug transport system fused ATPase/permease subunit